MAIKSKVKVKETKNTEEACYPKLMVHPITGSIFLITSYRPNSDSYEGTRLSTTSSSQLVGEYSTIWSHRLEDYKDKLTLSNK